MKKVLSILLCLTMLLSVLSSVCYANGQLVEHDEPMAEGPTVSAHAAILIDTETGKSLFEYDAEEKNYPGSTTKVMTAYLCLKYGDPDDVITVSSEAFCDITQAASTGDLVVGETMTVYRLLQNLLVISASEAANVVAEYISGSKADFVDLMNEEAAALGCTGTHFNNCHGLPDDNHYTTVRDMSLIASAAMQYDVFREIVGSAVTVMEPTNKHSSTKTIQSTNGILPGSRYTKYNYPYALGIKTGHTTKAGYCLISAAKKNGKELLCVIYGCPTRTSSFQQTIDLYEWAYENYDILTYSWGKYVQTEDLSVEIDEFADESEREGYETTESNPQGDETTVDSDFEETSLIEEPLTDSVETELISNNNEPLTASTESSLQSSEADLNTPAATNETNKDSSSIGDYLNYETLTGPLLPVFILSIVIVVLFICLVIAIVIAIVKRKKNR